MAGVTVTTVGAFKVAASSSLEDSAETISASWGASTSSTFSTVGNDTALAESDALDATGTIVMELALEAADENSSGVVMAVPNCMGGSSGTGGIPGVRELVRGASELRETDWLGSEILRDRPGCSLWMDSVSLVGLLGLEAVVGTLAVGGIETLCLTTGFISKSSWELVEPPELSTGDDAASLPPNSPTTGSGIRPVDNLLEDRLVRDESTILSTSLPFSEMLPASIGL
jgi:hypothetical protein